MCVTCTGAGLRAIINRRPSGMCPLRSIRMSMRSARIIWANWASSNDATSRDITQRLRIRSLVASSKAEGVLEYRNISNSPAW